MRLAQPDVLGRPVFPMRVLEHARVCDLPAAPVHFVK